MPLYLLFLALFLSFTNYSCAQYCLCKPGSQAPDPYQKVINYACGNGANCGPVQPNGPCYVANDIATICSYAANSYYQNQKTLGATCDFGGVAAPSSTLPTDLPSGCTFPTSAGPAGTTSNGTGTPTSPPGGLTPGPGTTSPGISSPTGFGPPGLGPPGLGPPGFGPPGFGPPGFGPSGFGGTPGFAPTGSFSDPNDAMSLLESPNHIVSLSLTLVTGILILWG